MQIRLTSVCAMVLLLANGVVEAKQPVELASIKFRSMTGDEPFVMAAQNHQVIVLDFFAHWCHPCRKVTPQLEQQIHQSYQQSGGNPQGIPVTVVPVNVDPSNPQASKRFLAKTGLKHAWEDASGDGFESIGKNRGLPLIAIVYASQSGELQLVHVQAGLDDIGALTTIINQIGK